VQGFLNLDKPSGMTSHDCVARIRRLLGERRVGHGGTLDPLATGVLPIAVGPMTRLLPYLWDQKSYRATVRLGIATSTDDQEGDILQQRPLPEVTLERVVHALDAFQGLIEQVPPKYSALHQDGKRLYELARAGVEVVIPSRPVLIYRIEVLNWHPGDFPELVLNVTCGPGTYIRALARDLGIALGGFGSLAGLVRTQSGHFTLANSCALPNRKEQIQLISPALALAHLPTVRLATTQAKALSYGQNIAWAGEPGIVQVWYEDTFLSVARCEYEQLKPLVTIGKLA
jgi:tRNA pseudouridine55 synthase